MINNATEPFTADRIGGTTKASGNGSDTALVIAHGHHDGTLLCGQMGINSWHGSTLQEGVLHLVLETAHPYSNIESHGCESILIVLNRGPLRMKYAHSFATSLFPPVLTIEGGSIRDISSFYEEINRVFMEGENWRLGTSLDALDDMLYGSYGILRSKACATVVWRHIHSSRAALGIEAPRAYYLSKLDNPELFKSDSVRSALEHLEHGGPTYFDLVLQVFIDHPHITLRVEDN